MMSAAKMQSALARVLLDRDYRAALRSAETGELGVFAELRQIDFQRLDEFAEHLAEKRCRIIKKWMPLTFRALELSLGARCTDEWLRRHIEERPRAGAEVGGHWLAAENEAVVLGLTSWLQTMSLESRRILDLLTFEAACVDLLQASPDAPAGRRDGAYEGIRMSDGARVVTSQCQLRELIAAVEGSDYPCVVSDAPSFTLLVRRERGVATMEIDDCTFAMLRWCQQPKRLTDVQEWINTSRSPSARVGLSEVSDAVRQLIACGALE